MVIAVDRGRYTVLVGGLTVTAMQARELGRRHRGRRPGRRRRRPVRRPGRAGPDRAGRGAPDRAAPHRRRRRPVRAGDRGQRRPAGVVAALADPPPRFGLIDRCLVAALSPGWSRCSASPRPTSPRRTSCPVLRRPGRRRRWSTHRGGAARELRERLAGRSGARRPLRGRQVDADQRAGPGGRARDGAVSAIGRAGTPRPRWSRCALPDRRVGHRHAGPPLVRAGARDRRRPAVGVPRPGGRARPVPAGVRASVARRAATWTHSWPRGIRRRPACGLPAAAREQVPAMSELTGVRAEPVPRESCPRPAADSCARRARGELAGDRRLDDRPTPTGCW